MGFRLQMLKNKSMIVRSLCFRTTLLRCGGMEVNLHKFISSALYGNYLSPLSCDGYKPGTNWIRFFVCSRVGLNIAAVRKIAACAGNRIRVVY
jgi:hypothetical protein